MRRERCIVGGNERLWTYDVGEKRLSFLRHDPQQADGIGPGSARWMTQDADGHPLAGALRRRTRRSGAGRSVPPLSSRPGPKPTAWSAIWPWCCTGTRVATCGSARRRDCRGAGEPKGSFATYRHDSAVRDSLLGNIVRVIHEDSAGNLWIGTDGGLNFLPAGIVTAPAWSRNESLRFPSLHGGRWLTRPYGLRHSGG